MALILVADDNEETCESIKGVLRPLEHTVHTVCRVADGIEQLQAYRKPGWKFGEPYAVAIIDLKFEKGYGGRDIETAGKHVLNEALKVPFMQPIILTAYPTIATATEAHEKGTFDYLIKQSGNQLFMGRLVDAVKKALEKRDSMMSLFHSLEILKGALESIRRNGLEGDFLDEAQNSMRVAETAFKSLLKNLEPLFRVTIMGKDGRAGDELAWLPRSF